MAIAFGKFADLGDNGGTGSLTVAYTPTSGATLLILAITGAAVGTSESMVATYAGSSMTLDSSVTNAGATSYNGRNVYLFRLFNPASGSNNFVISGAHDYILGACSDYTGTATSTVDATATGEVNTFSSECPVTISPVASNCWVIGAFSTYNTTAANDSNTVATTARGTGSAFNQPSISDTNAAVSTGSIAVQFASSVAADHGIAVAAASYAPADGAAATPKRSLMGVGQSLKLAVPWYAADRLIKNRIITRRGLWRPHKW
jgi:hypothetical protein